MLGELDELGKPPGTCVFAFRADYPPRCDTTIIRWLRFEELPSRGMLSELLLHLRFELSDLTLERVYSDPRTILLRIRGKAGWLHSSFFFQPRDVCDVDVAPDAVGLARCEPGSEALVIELLSNSVNPSVA